MLHRYSSAVAILPFTSVLALVPTSSSIALAANESPTTRTVGSTTTTEIRVQRHSRVSSKSFDEVVESLTKTIGRPDMGKFHKELNAASTAAELEEVVRRAIGSSGLMEFARYDAGAVLRLEGGGQGPRILRLVIGNPLIMQQMARSVPDAAAYAPLTILIDERADGVHLSYDSFSSLIAPYGSAEALAVAKDLDAKVEGLLEVAAR
jgi:uncharacterized protein (DUF302 family)